MVHATKSPGAASPVVADERAVSMAGLDGMLLDLCGAHAPYFTHSAVAGVDRIAAAHALCKPRLGRCAHPGP